MNRIMLVLVLYLSGLGLNIYGQVPPEEGKRGIVRIETPDGMIGTGFIILDHSNQRDFLVTNKHMLKACRQKDYFDFVLLRRNRFNKDGNVIATEEKDTLYLHFKGNQMYFAHPDSNVDLAIVPLGDFILGTDSVHNPSGTSNRFIYGINKEMLATRDIMRSKQIIAGIPVFMMGFSYQNIDKPQFHITRFGHIALFTSEKLPEAFTNKCFDTTYTDRMTSDWILLDIISRGGDSGGPVFAALDQTKEIYLIGATQGGTAEAELCYAIPSYYISDLIIRANKIIDKAQIP
jgi:hypothetical protein